MCGNHRLFGNRPCCEDLWDEQQIWGAWPDENAGPKEYSQSHQDKEQGKVHYTEKPGKEIENGREDFIHRRYRLQGRFRKPGFYQDR